MIVYAVFSGEADGAPDSPFEMRMLCVCADRRDAEWHARDARTPGKRWSAAQHHTQESSPWSNETYRPLTVTRWERQNVALKERVEIQEWIVRDS
jgi:hypothetical protein